MVKCSVIGCNREAVWAYGNIALCEYHVKKFREQLEKGVEGKIPPRGRIDTEFFDDIVVVTLEREDGRKLSVSMTKEELKNLAEYLILVIR